MMGLSHKSSFFQCDAKNIQYSNIPVFHESIIPIVSDLPGRSFSED